MRVPLLFLGFQRLFEFEFDVFFFSCCCVFFWVKFRRLNGRNATPFFMAISGLHSSANSTHTHTNDKTFLKWNEIRQFEQI